MFLVHVFKWSTKTKVIGKNVIVLPDEEYRKQSPYNLVFCEIFKWIQPAFSFTAITFCSELIRGMAISYKWINQPWTRNFPTCSTASIKIRFLLSNLRLKNYFFFLVSPLSTYVRCCERLWPYSESFTWQCTVPSCL